MCPPCADSSGGRWRAVLFGLMLLALAGCASTPPGSERAADAGRAATAKPGQPQGDAAAPTEEPLPPEAVQQFEQAVVHMSAGDTAQAEAALGTLAQAYPSYAGPLLNLGILYAKTGRLADAEKAIREAIGRNANNAIAFNQLGIVYRRLGRFKDADEAYQRAVQIDPNYALAHLNLGVLCDLYLQQPERALQAYERYLAVASPPDAKVNGWVNELKKRLGSAEPRAARAEQ